ncbi:hypothetical protein PGTUg99_023915 [Puccinia graminis f. sp. tritici]|nr:hypothetical protein PGTUg99_023915 [Puccinia graminis f. sp. tritici]
MRKDPFVLFPVWLSCLVSKSIGWPMDEWDPINWDELENLAEPSGRRFPQTSYNWDYSDHDYDYLNRDCLYSAQGGDHSTGTFHNGAIGGQRSDEGRGVANSLRSVAGSLAYWGKLKPDQVPKHLKKQKYDIKKAFEIQSRTGAWALDEAKNIDLHLIKKPFDPAHNGLRSLTLHNASPTHSVTYTLHDVRSDHFVWERSLDPNCKETFDFYSPEGTVFFYVDAGRQMIDPANIISKTRRPTLDTKSLSRCWNKRTRLLESQGS